MGEIFFQNLGGCAPRRNFDGVEKVLEFHGGFSKKVGLKLGSPDFSPPLFTAG